MKLTVKLADREISVEIVPYHEKTDGAMIDYDKIIEISVDEVVRILKETTEQVLKLNQ